MVQLRDRLCRGIESSTRALIFCASLQAETELSLILEAVDYSRQADIALSSDYMALSSEYRHSIFCVIKGVYQT